MEYLPVTQAPALVLEDCLSRSLRHEEAFGSEAESSGFSWRSVGLGLLKLHSWGPIPPQINLNPLNLIPLLGLLPTQLLNLYLLDSLVPGLNCILIEAMPILGS